MIHLIDLHFQGQTAAIAAFLVETTAGPVLVETGPHSTFSHLEKGIHRLGYKIEDIKHVFLSHIHLDHGGAAWLFAEKGAKIYVHPRGYPHLHDPSKLLQSAKMIYQDQMDALWGTLRPIAQENLQVAEHGQTFPVGNCSFTAWHTPGHAVHHIAWQLGQDLFAGDVAGVKIGNGPVVPPCPPPDINVEDWQNSLQLIRTLNIERLWLTHSQSIEMVGEHLDELETRLLDWANWIRPKVLEEKLGNEELIKVFTQFVIESFERLSLAKAVSTRYEVANPAGMSALGLKRHWLKKEASGSR
ncbi:MAG: MBL fold metallo-hydrolase [Saprospiraceae bacterium]